MKTVFYYVILVVMIFVQGFIITLVFSLAGWEQGGIHFNALLVLAFGITGWASPYIRKWLGIEEKEGK